MPSRSINLLFTLFTLGLHNIYSCSGAIQYLGIMVRRHRENMGWNMGGDIPPHTSAIGGGSGTPSKKCFFFHFWVSKYVERVITDVQTCPTVVLTEHKLLAACATDQLSNQ